MVDLDFAFAFETQITLMFYRPPILKYRQFSSTESVLQIIGLYSEQ